MKYKSLGEEGDIHPENTIVKQIKEQVDNAKGRHFKTRSNIAESYDVSPLVCSLRKERNLWFWPTDSATVRLETGAPSFTLREILQPHR